jgi:dGTPase
MFERVYFGEAARREQQRVTHIVEALLDHYLAAPDTIPAFAPEAPRDPVARVVDYLAGMTDRFCIREFERVTVPRALET